MHYWTSRRQDRVFSGCGTLACPTHPWEYGSAVAHDAAASRRTAEHCPRHGQLIHDFEGSLRPVVRGLVIVVGAIAVLQAVVAGEFLDRVSGRRAQLVLGVVDDVAAIAVVVGQRTPGQRMILFRNAKEATEAHYREHDVVGFLVQHYVFDVAQLFAFAILDCGADDLLGAYRRGVSTSSWHDCSSGN